MGIVAKNKIGSNIIVKSVSPVVIGGDNGLNLMICTFTLVF